MSSKLIVKNIPQSATEADLRGAFEKFGTVTNVQVKRHSNGVSRRFAFIGLNSVEEAETCLTKLNKTYIKGSRVDVEYARNATATNTDIKHGTSTDVAVNKSASEDLAFLKSKVEKSEPPEEVLKVKVLNFPDHWNKQDVILFLGKDFSCLKIAFTQKLDIPKFILTVDKKNLDIALKKNGEQVEGKELKVVQLRSKKAQIELEAQNKQKTEDEIIDTGRLFLRNLAYTATEEEVTKVFEEFGEIVETNIPIDYDTSKNMGFGFVTFLFPEKALRAYMALNGTSLHGRTLHILPGKDPPTKKASVPSDAKKTSYQKQKEEEVKTLSTHSYNWNTLFIGSNTVADALSSKYGVRKQDVLSSNSKKESIPVRIALGETKLVTETKQFLLDHGVNLDAFSQAAGKRSKTVILAKNLPVGTSEKDLRDLFTKQSPIESIVLPPSGLTALVKFRTQNDAKQAFLRLAYTNYKGAPLYLEWAPLDCFNAQNTNSKQQLNHEAGDDCNTNEDSKEPDCDDNSPSAVVFVKNLNFNTDESTLKEAFANFQPQIRSVVIARSKQDSVMLSRGYGFIEFKSNEAALEAMKAMQFKDVEGHKIELKLSNRQTLAPKSQRRTQTDDSELSTCKILVKNIPFEVQKKELQQLFATFGQVKFLRLPMKMASNSHRGFCFVEYHSLAEAKKAFASLSQSTHLLGRRLVLEWAKDVESVDDMRKRTAEKFELGQQQSSKRTKFDDNSLLQQDFLPF